MKLAESIKPLADEILAKAESLGINGHGYFEPASIPLRDDVLGMCEQNVCGRYNKTWTCPPANGSLESWREKMPAYRGGMVLQRICQLEDPFDFEGMMAGEEVAKNAFTELQRSFGANNDELLFLSVGGCTLCETCTYPDAPCRLPDLAVPSVESIGILVSELCTLSGIPYYNGEGTITYTGCVLMK